MTKKKEVTKKVEPKKDAKKKLAPKKTVLVVQEDIQEDIQEDVVEVPVEAEPVDLDTIKAAVDDLNNIMELDPPIDTNKDLEFLTAAIHKVAPMIVYADIVNNDPEARLLNADTIKTLMAMKIELPTAKGKKTSKAAKALKPPKVPKPPKEPKATRLTAMDAVFQAFFKVGDWKDRTQIQDKANEIYFEANGDYPKALIGFMGFAVSAHSAILKSGYALVKE